MRRVTKGNRFADAESRATDTAAELSQKRGTGVLPRMPNDMKQSTPLIE